ncbi:MAG: GNAT family N-acetyltransferase [Oscillospiraceae bacterium]|jgi:GNAT superfamily N-acetyltransferase|nr:GNAT family N-acetyltransferase [Oscillospiraceae bacterium]
MNARSIVRNADILRIAKAQSAVDCNCSAEDFDSARNVVVVSKANADARKYLELPFFCDLVSYGTNIVASVDERIAGIVEAYINEVSPAESFGTPEIFKLIEKYAAKGKILRHYLAEYWLPDVNSLRVLPCDFEVRLLEAGDFADLYKPEWSNALSPGRPQLDELAAGAYDGGTLIGLAGYSADCATMRQIGIDVLPGYRQRGIAAALTSRLAAEALERGKVPFYCCAWSNLASARNAIRSGFRPAWVELTAIDKEEGS